MGIAQEYILIAALLKNSGLLFDKLFAIYENIT